jgi:hypothetical protein
MILSNPKNEIMFLVNKTSDVGEAYLEANNDVEVVQAPPLALQEQQLALQPYDRMPPPYAPYGLMPPFERNVSRTKNKN